MPKRRKHLTAKTQYWIGYCRKSTDVEDKQIYSLGDQETMIAQHYERLPAEERLGRPLQILQEARSAYHPGRPVFNSIMRMADAGEVYGLLVVHPNRVSRNHADSGAFVQRLVEGRIRWLATTAGQRYTATDSNAIFMLTLENAMSWKDSRDKGERILQAMHLRAAEGKHMGQVRAGYRIVYRPDGTKFLEVDQDVAPLVQRLFQLAATGNSSLRVLTEEAWHLGIRNRQGKPFVRSAIYGMLRDPLYKGYIRFDGIVARGSHPPIIDNWLWNRVQDALSGRWNGAGRPKDPELRDLFVFGNLLRCPRCGHTLCPYRAKGKYIYYECKNKDVRCGVCVPQRVLLDQLKLLLKNIVLEEKDLEKLRTQLVEQCRGRSTEEESYRRTLNEKYQRVQEQIAEVFSQRKEAEALGVWDAINLRLTALTRERDELQAQLNANHEKGTAWIEKFIRSFELFRLLQEAIFHGPVRCRSLVLKALASNYSLKGDFLQPELRTPFRQLAEKGQCSVWCTEWYKVRTEIAETFELLQLAYELSQGVVRV